MLEVSPFIIVPVVVFISALISAAGILISSEVYKKYDPTDE